MESGIHSNILASQSSITPPKFNSLSFIYHFYVVCQTNIANSNLMHTNNLWQKQFED